MVRALHHKKKRKDSARDLPYGPRTRLIRGIYLDDEHIKVRAKSFPNYNIKIRKSRKYIEVSTLSKHRQYEYEFRNVSSLK